MKVEKRVQEMVGPARPVGEGRVMELSLCDTVVPLCYVPLALFFNEKPRQGFARLMKASLAHALALFYPCAGRVRRRSNGELDIECNDAGAPFVEAWVDASYSHFSPPFQPHPDFALLVPAVDLSAPAAPALLAQITHFKCGRACLGIQFHHSVCDGRAMTHFLSTWAMLTKSEANADLEMEELQSAVQPHFDRSLIQPSSSPSPTINHPEYLTYMTKFDDSGPLCTGKLFSFTPSDIHALRTSCARPGLNRAYTRFEILTAHLWRGIIRSKGLPPHQDTRLVFLVDGRKKFNPPLPQGYFGNVIFLGYIETRVGEVTENPLSFAADLIKDSIPKVSDAHMRSSLDWIAKQESPKSVCLSVCTPSVAVSANSWLRFPLYDLDFGWGKPSFVRIAAPLLAGLLLLLPSPLGEGHVDAFVGLQEDHMPKLEEYINDALKAK